MSGTAFRGFSADLAVFAARFSKNFSLSQIYDINYDQQCQHDRTHQLKARDDSERMPRQCEVSERYRKCLENRRVAGNQKTAWAMQ